MAGLTDQGFSVKRLNDIIAELQANAQTEFASLVQPGDIVNTSDTSVLGRWIKTVSAPIADLWQAAQDVYSAFDLYQATGDALENLTLLGGVSRRAAYPSTGYILAYGDYGTTVPADSFVKSTVNGKVVATDSDVVLNETSATSILISPTTVANSTVYSFTFKIDNIDPSATTVSITSDSSATSDEIVNAIISAVNVSHGTILKATLVGGNALIEVIDNSTRCTFTAGSFTISKVGKMVGATCTENGKNVFDENTLTSIQTPTIGLDSVTNPIVFETGDVIETDDALRSRYIVAKFQDSSNTYESIYAAVLKVNGVKQVSITENETDTAFVSPAVPPHSIYVVVLGGSEQDIAQAIWDNKAGGIGTYGSITKTVTDSRGIGHNISFDRPTNLDVYITVNVKKLSNYPLNGDDLIAAALSSYNDTLSVGDDVIYSRLFTPINSVPGHYVDSLYTGLTASPSGTTNISVAYNKIAKFIITVTSSV